MISKDLSNTYSKLEKLTLRKQIIFFKIPFN